MGKQQQPKTYSLPATEREKVVGYKSICSDHFVALCHHLVASGVGAGLVPAASVLYGEHNPIRCQWSERSRAAVRSLVYMLTTGETQRSDGIALCPLTQLKTSR